MSMQRPLTVACLQTQPRANFQSALDEALLRAEAAVSVGAEVLLLPEYCGGLKTEGRAFAPPAADESNHPVLLGLREFAALRNVWIVVGSVAITAPGGRNAVICDTAFGRIGFSICYDIRFPQLYRSLAQAGAEMLLIPAAFTKTTGEAHWHVLNRARAIETGAFVVSPCAVGLVEGGGESYGI